MKQVIRVEAMPVSTINNVGGMKAQIEELHIMKSFLEKLSE